jgi:hypothetical protein
MEGLEGLEDVNIQPFVGIANMREIVKSQFDKLEKDDSHQQYLVFRPVTVDDLDKIDRARDSIGNIRMTHYTKTSLLIVKLLLPMHEMLLSTFANRIVEKVVGMGVPVDEFCPIGATRSHGRNSSKEGEA